MTPCHVVHFVTPKKYLLNGLWFGSSPRQSGLRPRGGGPKKPKRVVIWVHGLGSSMFSKLKIAEELVDGTTAVLMFNNRGHDKVASLPHASGVFSKAIRGGAVHERFTDSADDIQGVVNFVRKMKVKNVYLAGHSTGCQKSVYWASKKGRGVRGVILLGPMSDCSALRLEYSRKKIERALSVARTYVRSGRGNELLPTQVWGWPWIADAQRFLSLYSGKGAEEIFTYWDTSRKPRALESVRIPTLVLLAEREEFSDIPAKIIATWFDAHLKAKHRVIVVPRVGHSFKGGERTVAREIKKFLTSK